MNLENEFDLEKVDSWKDTTPALPIRQEIQGIVRGCHIASPVRVENPRTGKVRMEYSIDICFNEEEIKQKIEEDMRTIAIKTWGKLPIELTTVVREGEFAGYPEKYYLHLTSIFKPMQLTKEIPEGMEKIATYILKPYNGLYKRAILTNLSSIYEA